MRGNTNLEDAFVKVSFQEDTQGGDSEAYTGWVDKATAKFAKPNLAGADIFRKLYPKHSLVMSQDYTLNILGFPGAYTMPLKPDELVTNAYFLPLGRSGNISGFLIDSVEFGGFRTAWDKYEFTVYILRYPEGFGSYTQHYILHDGPEEPARQLLVATGAWAWELHEEIWVFNQGFWTKDHNLWTEVQKANWDDVILKEDKKKALQKDVYSFFESEDLYKQLSIAWKRGLIMWGPPGNGKTISLKAIMKTVQMKGYNPLYIKSFQSWMGEEGAMQAAFGKARQLAPCVVILEDLDSLINDGNRSFFLNQLDGIEGNDGLLIIGTTNHFERLDPGLSSRPSRFDRKYKFDDPDRDERLLYANYWQNKLIDNEEIDFPDSLAAEIADITYGFSFAFLKESFVSTLVLLVADKIKVTFESAIKGQIKELRKQLDKNPPSFETGAIRRVEVVQASPATLPPKPDMWEAARTSMAQAAASLGVRRTSRTFVY